MAINMNQVLDYLDAQNVCSKADSMESLMEMLHDAYTSFSTVDQKKVQERFGALRAVWSPLPEAQVDDMFSLVCDLCGESEVLAFSQGVCAGMMLMTEVNRLP